MTVAPYTVEFTPAARRRLAKLPLAAAAALYEHIVGPVAGNPHRLGKPLEDPFDDVWSTRRGEYRALYAIDDDNRVITIRRTPQRGLPPAVTRSSLPCDLVGGSRPRRTLSMIASGHATR